MKEASLADNQRVAAGGVRFFLGADHEMDESSSDEDDDAIDIAKLKHQAGVTKKTRKKTKVFEKALATVKKVSSSAFVGAFVGCAGADLSCRKSVQRKDLSSLISPLCSCCMTRKGLPNCYFQGICKAQSRSSILHTSFLSYSLCPVWSVYTS